MPGHHVDKCKHGTVMGQCRCFGPKETRIVACPPEHADWIDVTTLPTTAPTDIAQPPSTVPTLADYGAGGERKRIVAFLRAKVEELGPAAPTGMLSLVKATLLDAATWIENGDHVV